MRLVIIAGHDPTGGAGIVRDRLTVRAVAPQLAHDTVVTAETEQGDGAPARVYPRAPETFAAALARLGRPTAVKVGLIPDALGPVLAVWLRVSDAPVVVDPVLWASDGGWLGATPEGLALLLARATLITPNWVEAQALAGTREPALVLPRLRARFPQAAILIKGGHAATGDRVVDRLVGPDDEVEFARPRRPGPDPRGTGCALATAIAARIAGGHALRAAVAGAVAWLDEARLHTVARADGTVHLAPPGSG